jgi:hypothetical protein
MTLTMVKTILEELGVPLAYDHFAEGESPEPPFLIFTNPSDEGFGADNIVYAGFPEVNAELYTDKKQPDLEKAFEAILDRHEIFYLKTETWIASEKLYEVLYELTL